MLIPACKAKIHRAVVTQAELDYVGSISIDQTLLEASGIREFQYLNITNLRKNGIIWRTYAMAAEKDSGVICLNGPPKHYFKPGDLIVILAEVFIEDHEFDSLNPVVVFVDDTNKITQVRKHKVLRHPLA